MKNKTNSQISVLKKVYDQNLKSYKIIEKKLDYCFNSIKESGEKLMKVYEKQYLKRYKNLKSLSNIKERKKAFFQEYCFLEDFLFKVGYLPREISDFKSVLELEYVDLKYNNGKLTNELSYYQVQAILFLNRYNSYMPPRESKKIFKEFVKMGFVVSKVISNKEYFKLSKIHFKKINYMYYEWQEERFILEIKNNWIFKL